MKNFIYVFLLIGACVASPTLHAQSSTENQRITITKEIRQVDGTVIKETIIKEGEAAEDFDLDDYIEQSKEEDITNLNIEIGSGADVRIERTTVSTPRFSCSPRPSCSKKGFLGVSHMRDNERRAGAVVSIVRGSAAQQAGMQRGDRILQINDARIDDFDDISDFMRGTTVGQELEITIERNGAQQTLRTAIGTRNTQNSWLDNFDLDQTIRVSKEACLGVYSSRTVQDEVVGSRISGFTNTSAARAAGFQKGDIITAVEGNQVDGHDELWDALATYNVGDVVNIDFVRAGLERSIAVGLNPCRGNTEVNERFEHSDNAPRINTPRPERLGRSVIREVIVIKKIDDTVEPRIDEAAIPSSDGRKLNLNAYRAFPNPTEGIVNIEFQAAAEPIVVSLYDVSGQKLFSEEVNSFGGSYFRQFDLSAYTTSKVVVVVEQEGQVFSEQIVVQRNLKI